MNLSKIKDIIIQQRAWIAFAIWVLFMLAIYVNGGHGFDDFYFYTSPYPGLSDWHSPWGAIKFRFLRHVLDSFSMNYELIGRSFVRFLVLSFIFLGAAIFNYTIKRQGLSTRFFLLFLFFLPLCSFGIEPRQVRLADTNYLALSQLLFLISILYYSFVVRIKSKVLFAVLFILLWDTVAWRTQCLLLVPFLLWFFFYLFPFRSRLTQAKRICLTALVSCVIIIGQSFFYSHVLDVKKMSGETVMMVSDICSVENMLQINQNREFSTHNRKWTPILGYALPENKSSAKPVIGQSFCYLIKESTGEVTGSFVLKNSSDYYQYRQLFIDDIQRRWKEVILTYPQEFLTFRLLCLCQLSGSQNYAFGMVPYMETRYPHVQIHQPDSELALNSLSKLFKCSNLSEFVNLLPKLNTYTRLIRDLNVRACIISHLAIPIRSIFFLWLVFGAYLLFVKNRFQSDANLRVARLCYLLAFIYLLSLVPYTPTPDYRYMATALVLGGLSLVMYFVSLASLKSET